MEHYDMTPMDWLIHGLDLLLLAMIGLCILVGWHWTIPILVLGCCFILLIAASILSGFGGVFAPQDPKSFLPEILGKSLAIMVLLILSVIRIVGFIL